MRSTTDIRNIQPGTNSSPVPTRNKDRRGWAHRAMLALLGVFLISGLTAADEAKVRGADQVLRSGKTMATKIDLDLRSLPVVTPDQAWATDESAKRREDGQDVVAQGQQGGFRDPLVAAQQVAVNKSTLSWTVDLNVAGIGFSGATPADPAGEVGGQYFVQMVNAPKGSLFAVFDTTTGSMVSGPSKLESLWQGGGACGEGWGHPYVVHDAVAQRWILSEVGAGNHLCVYVSQTNDPITGGWFAYDFALPKFPDFAKIGMWADDYFVATNEDLPTVYALERAAMLGGSPAGWQRFTAPTLGGFGFQSLTPVDLDGSDLPPAGTGGLFVRHSDGQVHGGVDRLELFELDVDWGSPQSSNLSGPVVIALAPFDSTLCGRFGHACVPQPGTTVALDPIREVVSSSAHYRKLSTHESLVGNFTVDTNASNHAGIRWFELRRDGGSWFLYQEGTYSPDSLHRWIGGVAMDRDGNLALAFNVSHASSTYPSIRVTGREAADALGVMTVSELELQAGTSPQTHGHSPDRWGASTQVSVSPLDDCTFWATAAFAQDGGWGTRIASFRSESCDTGGSGLIFADGFESGNSSNWSSVFP